MSPPSRASATSSALSTIHITPIWKLALSESELRNVTRSIDVTTASHIEFLAPASLDTAYYQRRFPQASIRRVADHHLSSVRSYSELMLTEELYSWYSEFTFMLLVQSDAVLLKPFDERAVGAFDYVGAPWMPDMRYLTFASRLWVGPNSKDQGQTFKHLVFSLFGRRASVGNGGLSMRRIAAFRLVTKRLRERYSRLSAQAINEDVVFGTVGPRLGLKAAPKSHAARLLAEHISISDAEALGILGVHAPIDE